MSQKTVHLHLDESSKSQVAILTLDRPEALNALNRDLLESLEKTLDDLARNETVRAVILTGAGAKAFVAGADIKEMQNMSAHEAEQMSLRGQRIFQKIEDMPKAMIAAVNGFALGGGFELALSCDFIVAADSAKFGLPEVSLGLIPGYGGTQRLARSVGKSMARMMSMTGDIFSAAQLASWGLVSEVVPLAELMPLALKRAMLIAARGPKAVALTKASINRGYEVSLNDGLKVEASLFGEVFSTQDHHEGINAFIEKRKPQFTGK